MLLRNRHTVAHPQVPLPHCAVLACRVDDVVLLAVRKFEGRYALSVALEVGAFFYLPNVPHFQQAVIST